MSERNFPEGSGLGNSLKDSQRRSLMAEWLGRFRRFAPMLDSHYADVFSEPTTQQLQEYLQQGQDLIEPMRQFHDQTQADAVAEMMEITARSEQKMYEILAAEQQAA